MNVLSWPAIVTLEITPQCNNRCPGCSNVYAAERPGKFTSAEQWEAWLANFAAEAVQIRITGGEPTLHPEFFRIFDAANSYDALITLFTNARWHNPEAIIRHVRGRERFMGMLISLHGVDAHSHEAFTHVPGSFAETVDNIRRAVDAGIPVTLSTVMTLQSLPEIEAMLALRKELGAQYVAFNRFIGSPMPEIEPSAEQMREAIQRLEQLLEAGEPIRYGIGVPQCFVANASEGCLAGVGYVSIDPWGRLRPCAHSPSVVGSLQEASFAEVWHGEDMNAWRKRVPAECLNCAVYSSCHGGCRAVQELRPDGRDSLRCDALSTSPKAQKMMTISPEWKIRATCRLRPEPFGYAALGNGAVFPVRSEARELILACDGQRTAQELVTQYGNRAIKLIGEMLRRGLIEVL